MVNGTLIVVFLRAKNLPNRRRLDKQDPYCVARIGSKIDRTKAEVRGGQTPEWNSEIRFEITPGMHPLMKVSLLDEQKKAPVLIGDCQIDISPVFSASCDEGYDKWHSLQFAGRKAGEVYIEMTFYPTLIEAPKRYHSPSSTSFSTSNYSHYTVERPLPSVPGREPDLVFKDSVAEREQNPQRSPSPSLSPQPTAAQTLYQTFDDLEREVQRDWVKTHTTHKAHKPRYDNIDPLKISQHLPKLPDFSRAKLIRKPPMY